MGISPIFGIVADMPVPKAPPVDLGLTVVSDIENSARTRDETYSPSGGKSASGDEDGLDEQPGEDEADSESKSHESGLDGQISFFA
jgi:hypothetical protein